MRIYLSAQKKYAYPVSVIIPMYNAEEFIAECLDSLLIQTFQDFEVIVIDDCSTDSSPSIVESYAPKFNGRLKLTKTKKNSGGGGYIPRNIGINLASGKYIQFLDSDDFLLGSALETLYKAAEKFRADITYSASHYWLDGPNEIHVCRDARGKDLAAKNLEDKPTFIGNDTSKIIEDYLHRGGHHASWAVFVKRDFLLENRLLFPEKIYNGGDGIWNLHIRYFSKRFLRIPDPVYFWRHYNFGTITRKKRSPAEQFSHKGRAFSLWLKALWELSNKLDFLKKNPSYAYDLFKPEIGWFLKDLREYREQLSDHDIYENFYHELATVNNSPDWMMPFFLTFINSERKLNNYYSDILNKFKRYLMARLDIKLITEDTGDFQIVSVSDDKAKVKNPDWLQKGGIGYVIQSYAGKLKIIAKATVSGKFKLKLRGMAVSDSEDKSKRIPYWIDYTKLTVNDQVIFDSLTSAWHDKPYLYNMKKVNAGDEIKIQVEWLPHRSDI